MKVTYWVSPMDPTYVRTAPGKDPMGHDLKPVETEVQSPQPAAAKKDRKIKYYVSPMDPGYVTDKPGKAPCGMDMVPVYEDEAGAGEAGVIAVSPAFLQTMGVRLTKVEAKALSRSIRAVGKVAVDERGLTQVTTKVNGYVNRLYFKVTGDPIRKGRPLLSLYSPELVATQKEYLLALKNMQAVSQSPFPEIKDSARRLMEATRQRLAYWDIPPAQIEALERRGQVAKDLTLTSPVTGIVMKRLVTQGQYVQAGMPLLEVVDLSSVWVEAEVYEYELPWIKLGQHAHMTLTSLPGETFHGTVSYLYPMLSGMTRTAKVRLAFANPGLKLKPEMFVQVEIVSPLAELTVVVPSEAVMDTGEKQHVFVALGQGRFAPREVKLGVHGDGGLRQVLSGLKEGEEVVTSAQFLLDSESRFREAVAQMLKAKPGEPGEEPAPGEKPAAPPVHKH
jgi:Cu(I)/Ag(I) efflux system membrane fusion protein/cobalt-zinc-cadmium efflux system membrane fusion protein